MLQPTIAIPARGLHRFPRMKPTKLFACLVTLTLCGFPSSSAVADELRTWTDTQGRTIEASLLGFDPSKDTIEIQRADGTHFNLPVSRLSETDRVFIKGWVIEQSSSEVAGTSSTAKSKSDLKELTPKQWEWLAGTGSVQPRRYVRVPAKEMAALLNVRLESARSASRSEGAVTGVRIDEDSGVDEITTEVRNTMSFASFLREIAVSNGLSLFVDAKGAIVLQRTSAPAGTDKPDQPAKIEFLGISS
jgi:hypothetical protein